VEVEVTLETEVEASEMVGAEGRERELVLRQVEQEEVRVNPPRSVPPQFPQA